MRYRVVHFVPDPFSGARVPIAALVANEGRLFVTAAPHLPSGACLGGPRSELALKLVLEAVGGATSLDALPAAAGPQAVLGPVTPVPGNVANPTEWVRRFVLPQPTTSKPKGQRAKKRQTLGYRFFEQNRVAPFVHQTFKPDEHWGERVGGTGLGLSSISHWAGSDAGRLMLLEPLVPERLEIGNDVREVYSRLAGYQVFLEGVADGAIKEQTELCVYMLPGATDEARMRIRTAFGPVHARLFSVDVDAERDELLATIRALGEAAESQARLAGLAKRPVN